ncbi:helix-turn-helix domain-containing protein [Lacticaseibacillus jixiensis]|uniref:helix-turn-helix domain-containing protein n=1 Tax=Lacticaseibacillus jixiensis TaxID=3231926 RepID=UPI0036F22AD3
MLKMGKLIQAQRQHRGLSQSDLAAQLHVTRQAVSKWENDQSYPDVDMLVKLAQIFQCDVRVLLGLKQKMQWRGLFRWRAEDKAIKWYAGGGERRRLAISLLVDIIATLPPKQASLKELLRQQYQRLMTDGTATPYVLMALNLQVSSLMHREHFILPPEAEAKYQQLLRLSNIRYR